MTKYSDMLLAMVVLLLTPAFYAWMITRPRDAWVPEFDMPDLEDLYDCPLPQMRGDNRAPDVQEVR